MSNVIDESEKSIAGISIKTSNSAAPETIPALWGRFFGEKTANTIPAKVSDDVYAVYTDFENVGVNNNGEFTFLIGVEVATTDSLTTGLEFVTIPNGSYHKFNVADNDAEQVFPTWMNIWSKDDIGKTYVCDFELYDAAGNISINVGTNQSD